MALYNIYLFDINEQQEHEWIVDIPAAMATEIEEELDRLAGDLLSGQVIADYGVSLITPVDLDGEDSFTEWWSSIKEATEEDDVPAVHAGD